MELTGPTRAQVPRDKLKGEPISESLSKLLRDGSLWIAAEAALAKAELTADGKRLAVVLFLSAVIIGSIGSAVMLASAAIVLLLAPHVGGIANAAGFLALVLAVLAAASGWWIFHLVQSRLGIASILKRWGVIAAPARGSDR